MACLWGLFGVLVGVATLSRPLNAAGVIAGMVAGLIILVPLGVLLGLAGGRPGLTLVGGVGGTGLGAVTGLLAGAPDAPHLASMGLISGAVTGATLHLVFWTLSLVRTPLWTAYSSHFRTK
jgi:hypothetical protein